MDSARCVFVYLFIYIYVYANNSTVIQEVVMNLFERGHGSNSSRWRGRGDINIVLINKVLNKIIYNI